MAGSITARPGGCDSRRVTRASATATHGAAPVMTTFLTSPSSDWFMAMCAPDCAIIPLMVSPPLPMTRPTMVAGQSISLTIGSTGAGAAWTTGAGGAIAAACAAAAAAAAATASAGSAPISAVGSSAFAGAGAGASAAAPSGAWASVPPGGVSSSSFFSAASAAASGSASVASPSCTSPPCGVLSSSSESSATFDRFALSGVGPSVSSAVLLAPTVGEGREERSVSGLSIGESSRGGAGSAVAPSTGAGVSSFAAGAGASSASAFVASSFSAAIAPDLVRIWGGWAIRQKSALEPKPGRKPERAAR